MKKRLLILLLCLSLLTGIFAGTATATSTPDSRLEVVRILGILVGDTRGNLMLDQPVTRAQFTKMMVAASPYKDSVASSSGTSLFKDVKSAHWASGYIKVGVDQQWIIGYVDGTFRPDRTITLEEGCTALLRVLGYNADSLVGAYPSAQLTKAEAIGLRDDLTCKQGQILTRRDCVTLLYNTLTATAADGKVYGTCLGCSVTGDEIDYTSLVKLDTKGPFVTKDGKLNLPFTQENITVYRDGRIASAAAISPEDVYYYHANLRTIWAYSEKVTGLIGNYAGGTLTIAGKNYAVTTSDASYALSGQGSFRKDDLATVLLGKDNDVVQIRVPTEAERSKFYYEDSPAAIAEGTEGPFVTADGKLDIPFDLASATVYRDNQTATASAIQPEDVYYYHENLKTVWLYSEKVTGLLGAFNGSSVSLAGKNYAVTTSNATYALSGQGGFREGDIATALLGKSGDIVRVRAASEAERNKFFYEDSPASIATDTEGPFVVENGVLDIPFDRSTATFYRNGRSATASEVTDLDVYYYHKNLKTVWLFSDRVTGTLTAVGPNRIAPTTATVSGVTYNVTAGAATFALSGQGTFRNGDSVTLLLGMNGDVVRVLPADAANSLYYGMVLSSTNGAASESTGTAGAISQTATQVVCSDGTVRTFYHTGASHAVGSLVSISVNSQGTALRGLNEQHLSGTVNGTGTGVGQYQFADNVEILDTDSYGNYVKIYGSRLAGATLKDSDVRYYTTNGAGKIDRLILNQATGDLWDYCFIIDSRTGGGGMSISASYSYYKNGQPGTVSGNTQYPVKYGGAVMISSEGKLKNMRQLSSVPLVLVSDQIAMGQTARYKLADNVQFLIKDTSKSDTYYAAELEDTDLSKFELTGWYDSFGCAAGAQIRVIVALPK